jgi:lipoprotein-releasing system ATP-binding protein
VIPAAAGTAPAGAAAAAAGASGAAVLEARGIHKEFPSGEGRLEVLRGVDLEVAAGGTVSVTGESGAGKSTLLHILGGLDRPSRGSVRLAGADLDRLDDAALSALRNRWVGFVFQFHHLLMDFSALENAMMPLLLAGEERGYARRAARAVLERVGLGGRLSHRPRQLSGGEQQRVAVARALVHEPRLVLADEPSGNLDERNSELLHDLLFELVRERGVALVVVTHDRDLAGRTARRLRLEDGILRAT